MTIFYSKKQNLGFTLIELLVVVSIISMLASIVLSSLSNAKIKATDAAKIAEVKEVKNALALYQTDYRGYPATISDLVSSGKYIKFVSPYVNYSALEVDGVTQCNTSPCSSYAVETTLNNGTFYNGITSSVSGGSSINTPAPTLANIGEGCEWSGDCVEGLICELINYKCSDRSNGSGCESDGECESGFCNFGINRCTNGDCFSNSDCLDHGGYCSSGNGDFCTDGSEGSPCDTLLRDETCQDGLTCSPETGSCIPN